MTRKFFTLQADEEFLGVVRPSLWTLFPRIFLALLMIILPFLLWRSLFAQGIVFDIVISGLLLVVGTSMLRDIRRQYLENGLYLTTLRAIDVHARRRSCVVTELFWNNVARVHAPRNGVGGLVGYGALHIEGNEDVGFSLVLTPLHRPELVVEVISQVYSS